MKRLALPGLLVLMLSVAALAHAHLKTASPAQGATVKTVPATVHLEFSEEVDLKLSVFKVYPLSSRSADLKKADEGLIAQVLKRKDDSATRVDAWMADQGNRAQVDIPLKPGLKAGAYVVMWRVLAADDGHITGGHYTFSYRP